jgi:hypothetical protein
MMYSVSCVLIVYAYCIRISRKLACASTGRQGRPKEDADGNACPLEAPAAT